MKIIRYPEVIKETQPTDSASKSKLKSSTTTADSEQASKPECPICLEPLEDSTTVMPCGHIFDFSCIKL
jgi:hypothetical protein